MSLYNDQKVATDRVGKKVLVKSESVESPIKIRVIEESVDEDPYNEVVRENMRSIISMTEHND